MRHGLTRAWVVPGLLAGALGLAGLAASVHGVRAQPAAEEARESRAVVHAVALSPRANGATLAIELSGEVPYMTSVMAQPDRIVIDLPKVAFQQQAVKSRGRIGPVTAFRYGLFIADRSRIVLDLAEPTLLERVDTREVDGRRQYLFHFARTERAKFVEAARADADRRKLAAPAVSSAAVAPDARPKGKPVVVIDPGHGGIDGGAATRDGDAEKTIVLALALELRDALERTGRVKVELTRTSDAFVSLGERVAFAREKRADLMVSLHADKLVYERGVRGASIYTVSEKASDVISAKLADSENASDQVAGLDSGPEEGGAIGDILFDLTKRETRFSSISLARQLAGELPHVTSMHKTPLRAAGFKVLTAPDVPSVLIETGYLSSSEDAKLMKTSEWRGAMAKGIAAAIEKYLGQNATRVLNSAARP